MDGAKAFDVWNIEHVKNDTGHGTQKLIKCMRRPIVNNSRVSDAVYEPFDGSGSRIIAAHIAGRAVSRWSSIRCTSMSLFGACRNSPAASRSSRAMDIRFRRSPRSGAAPRRDASCSF